MLSAVIGFRCVRKRLDQFYDCETNEDCAMVIFVLYVSKVKNLCSASKLLCDAMR